MDLRVMADQTDVCPGASVNVAPSNIPQGATLDWSLNGQSVSQGPSFTFGTTGRDPGSYTIGLTAAAPEFNKGTANTTVNLLPYRAPTGSLQVSPSEIWVGEQATLTPNFAAGQCGGSLRAPELAASEGSISGTKYDSTGVQFDPSDNSEQRKTVKLMARAADDKGAATAEATIVVKRKAVATARRLPDIIFPQSSARVNNCGKRVLLEDLKSLTDSDPTGKVVFVGHETEKEQKVANLDRLRALNAAAVISAGQGICTNFPASQIMVSAAGAAENGVEPQPHFCGTSAVPKTGERSGSAVRESDAQAQYRRVEVWFVPTGGAVPASVKDQQDASAMSVSSLGCPK
jgi:hypothetical protein